MIELAYAGKLNVFWFIVSLLTVFLSILETIGFWPIFLVPSFIKYFWTYLLIVFLCINVILKVLYTDFIYAVSYFVFCEFGESKFYLFPDDCSVLFVGKCVWHWNLYGHSYGTVERRRMVFVRFVWISFFRVFGDCVV